MKKKPVPANAVIYRKAQPADVPGIEALLNALYVGNLPEETARTQGFIAVPVSRTQVEHMCQGLGMVVAVQDTEILGALGLSEIDTTSSMPILKAMYAAIPDLLFEGKPLTTYPAFVFGPVAVSQSARGQGIFKGLYRAMWASLDALRYGLGIAFIAQDNPHSLVVHRDGLGTAVVGTFSHEDTVYWLIAYPRSSAVVSRTD